MNGDHGLRLLAGQIHPLLRRHLQRNDFEDWDDVELEAFELKRLRTLTSLVHVQHGVFGVVVQV